MNTPILRSFEYQGKQYIYGEAILFNVADSHGTIMRRQIAEDSEPYLRRFGSVRFMHEKPFARLIWDTEIDGHKTEITDSGFSILAEVYDNKNDEWAMITRGGWGLSFGFMPNDINNPFETINGKRYFARGLLYEISVVDSPSCQSCVAYTITRNITNIQPTAKRITYRMSPFGFEKYEVDEEGRLHTPEPELEEEKPYISEQPILRNIDNPNYSEEHIEHLFPETCTPQCPHRTCPYHRAENYGKPCQHRIEWELKKNKG